jgi:hypothetical protein
MGVPRNKLSEIAKIKAVQHIRPMNGGSEAHMCKCSDGYNYIVKFQNNPQGNRTLVNDLLGTLLARYLGLPVPETAIVEVTEDLRPGEPDGILRYDPGTKLGQPGKCFGSKYLEPRMPGSHHSNSFEPGDLNRGYLSKLGNLKDFAGMLVFDKWTCNTDPRQVIFTRDGDAKSDRVVMIDFGYCFHACNWDFRDNRLRGVLGEWYVYNTIEGMETFEPWLRILENSLDEGVLRDLAELIPPEWYDFNRRSLTTLLASLNERRKLVRELLWHCCSTNEHSFRNWMKPADMRYFVASA